MSLDRLSRAETGRALIPTGQQAAGELVDKHIQPLAQQVADEAEPRARAATQQYLRDPASELAERAVPVTEQLTKGTLQPGAQQVRIHAMA